MGLSRQRSGVVRAAGREAVAVSQALDRKPGLDLVAVPGVGRFLRWRHARAALQAPLLLVGLVMVLDGLAGPQFSPENVATVFTWIHYRGFVVLALLVVGNLFCIAGAGGLGHPGVGRGERASDTGGDAIRLCPAAAGIWRLGSSLRFSLPRRLLDVHSRGAKGPERPGPAAPGRTALGPGAGAAHGVALPAGVGLHGLGLVRLAAGGISPGRGGRGATVLARISAMGYPVHALARRCCLAHGSTHGDAGYIYGWVYGWVSKDISMPGKGVVRGAIPILIAGREFLLVMLLWLGLPLVALAHSGGPFPVLLDEQVGPYTVSALADPDVGVGTFIIMVAVSGKGDVTGEDTEVTVWVVPEDGHQPEAGYRCRYEETREGPRFVANVPFDAEGMWLVRLEIAGSAGSGEVSFKVRVTPPGPGWVRSLLCLTPFIGLGALWLLAAVRHR